MGTIDWGCLARLLAVILLLRWGWGRLFVGTVALVVGLIGVAIAALAWSEPEAPSTFGWFALAGVGGAALVAVELRRVRPRQVEGRRGQRGDSGERRP